MYRIRQRCTRLGPVHDSTVQRLRRSEDVSHGLSCPELTLLNDCIQLQRGGVKETVSVSPLVRVVIPMTKGILEVRNDASGDMEPSWLRKSNLQSGAAHLSAADGQGPVKHRPGDCLLTSRGCHGAHVAVVAVELPGRWDDVTELKIWDRCAAALTKETQAEAGLGLVKAVHQTGKHTNESFALAIVSNPAQSSYDCVQMRMIICGFL